MFPNIYEGSTLLCIQRRYIALNVFVRDSYDGKRKNLSHAAGHPTSLSFCCKCEDTTHKTPARDGICLLVPCLAGSYTQNWPFKPQRTNIWIQIWQLEKCINLLTLTWLTASSSESLKIIPRTTEKKLSSSLWMWNNKNWTCVHVFLSLVTLRTSLWHSVLYVCYVSRFYTALSIRVAFVWHAYYT